VSVIVRLISPERGKEGGGGEGGWGEKGGRGRRAGRRTRMMSNTFKAFSGGNRSMEMRRLLLSSSVRGWVGSTLEEEGGRPAAAPAAAAAARRLASPFLLPQQARHSALTLTLVHLACTCRRVCV